MFVAIKAWYIGLSAIAKTGVITAGSVAGLGVVGATLPAANQQQINCVSTVTSSIETQPISYSEKKVDDSSLTKDVTKITTIGQVGQELKHQITKFSPTGCSQDKDEIVSETTTKNPVDQVTSVGTYVVPPAPVPAPRSSNCNVNYSGCVPNASDVDCVGGSGNGPSYASGPIKVTGTDVYGLDRDGDGIACE